MAAATAARLAVMPPSTPRHTSGQRDRAVRRLRRITASVAVGGASAVGLIGWGLSASAHTTAAATTTSSTAATATGTASSPTSPAGASPTPAASSQPASSATSSSTPAHAVTGGSGHG